MGPPATIYSLMQIKEKGQLMLDWISHIFLIVVCIWRQVECKNCVNPIENFANRKMFALYLMGLYIDKDADKGRNDRHGPHV